MKTVRIVVFAMALAGVGAVSVPAPSHPRLGLDLAEGRGFLDFMACGGCLGSGALAAATGWGAFWTAAMSAGDGTLASACVDACLSVF